MKTRTKSILSLLALSAVMSTQAFAERGDEYESEMDTFQRRDIEHRFQDQARGNRFRRQHRKKIDICRDVKQNLVKIEEIYFEFEESVKVANKGIKRQQDRVNNKSRVLSQKQASFDVANNEVVRLNEMNKTKPQVLRRNKARLASVNKQIPTAQALVTTTKAKEKRECKSVRARMGLDKSCNKAERARKRAEKALNNLVASKTQAQNIINDLNNIGSRLTVANKALRIAGKNLTNEQNARPTLVKLEKTLQNLVTQRDNSNNGYAEAEEQYYKVGIRKELCMETQFEARKAKAFKHAMLVFVADNGNGCDNAFDLISRTRGFAAVEGVKEAHELVCKSDTLVRVEEVEIEVGGQCSEEPSEPQVRERTVKLNDPIVSVNIDNQDGIKNARTIFHDGAKQIKVDIDGFDIEFKWDFLVIEDGNGNEVGRFQNPKKGQPETNTVSTGWVDGDTLIIRYQTDTGITGAGFTIDSYQVVE
jgi:hypothetical protein